MASENVEEGPKGTRIQWRCKGSEAENSLVNLKKLIGGGSLRTESRKVGEEVDDRNLWYWGIGMECGSTLVPAPTSLFENLPSPNLPWGWLVLQSNNGRNDCRLYLLTQLEFYTHHLDAAVSQPSGLLKKEGVVGQHRLGVTEHSNSPTDWGPSVCQPTAGTLPNLWNLLSSFQKQK